MSSLLHCNHERVGRHDGNDRVGDDHLPKRRAERSVPERVLHRVPTAVERPDPTTTPSTCRNQKGRRGAGDQGRGCSERTRITSAACPMGDLDHRRVQQLAQRLSGQNRCARSFKPAPRCHLATRDRCACSSRSQGQADHREGGQMRCSQRAAHQELAAAWRAAGLCQSAAAGVLRCSRHVTEV